MFKIFLKVLLLVFCLSLFACASSLEPKKRNVQTANSFTLAEKNLLEIIDEQKAFDLYLEQNGNKNISEIRSKIKSLDLRWEEYLRGNPKNVNALIIYGKYLRKTDRTEEAYKIFQKADKLENHLAIIKQQLATYEGEDKNYKDSYAHLKEAINLEPKNAIYHFQLGELLYLKGTDMAEQNLLSTKDCDAQMIEAFKTAKELDPNNGRYALRYAQTFFDLQEPNCEDALKAFDNALSFAGLNFERDEILIQKTKILLKLKRAQEAQEILKKINSEHLQKEKNYLQKLAEKILNKETN